MRTRTLVATFALVGLFAACEQSPTTPDPALEVEAALLGNGAAFADGGAHPAILSRLVHVSLAKLRRDSGAEAAQAAAASLRPLVAAARDARAARDTAAARAANDALRHAEATLVVNTLGTEAVTRTLAFATRRVHGVSQLAERAATSGRDATRLQTLAANMRIALDAANAAAAAGDNVGALLGATRIIEVLHQVETRSRRQDRAG